MHHLVRLTLDGEDSDAHLDSLMRDLAWGQIRCENVTPERAKQLVASDEHSP